MRSDRMNSRLSATAETIFIGIGSNLGHRRQTCELVLVEMNRLRDTQVIGRSPWYRTDPQEGGGEGEGGEFINGVARLQTALQPLELLALLEKIEIKLGREDKGQKNPRTIDLDILLIGDRVINTARLIVPHPRLITRAFVLRPLMDLAPLYAIPPQHMTVSEYWRNLEDKSGVHLIG